MTDPILLLTGSVGVVGIGVLACVGLIEIRRKHIINWLRPYLILKWNQLCASKRKSSGYTTHILFCVVDHFEPISYGSTREQERARMNDWICRYPVLAGRHRDSCGRHPQHTWFYPGEKYDAEYLDGLVQLCRQGLGEIELHLHHGHDSGETLRVKIQKAISEFARHGALVTQEDPPRQVYGFIHGNMALDNSREDPSVCGVNDEITILKETGCYADYSLPTAPCISQASKVNAIYYVVDDPLEPKSHDTGIDAAVGHPSSGDLLIISGPLGFNWSSRKYGCIPRIENSEIQESNPPTPQRIRNWVAQGICVAGRPDWVFVKVSCHGAEDSSRPIMLGTAADIMFDELERQYRDRPGFRLHYVTAREMYNLVKAAEADEKGDPEEFLDYTIPPYETHRT